MNHHPPPIASIVSVVLQQYKHNHNVDFPNEIHNNYMNDSFLLSIVKMLWQYKNFALDNGLLYSIKGRRQLLCIPDVVIGRRTAKETVIDEGHSLLAHLGPEKTLAYLFKFVW
ncbi:hypothetical protein BDN71DRAFT_1388617 [Pleurotus eryngii]|uniref:Integrase zinc-binding domain-containing protein n=1 Tax=Pleurotus eryngii TaxID=5323 RepID=A0A9P5ZYX6_PLEER|nr:hypothetical protein BDN71DRAFT_1388617 [Pleurotus eryngii]